VNISEEESDPSVSAKKSQNIIYIGFGHDKDGSILKSLRECQTRIQSLEQQDFVIYLPILKTRFTDIDKYINTQQATNLIPLQTNPLKVFLRFTYTDEVDLSSLKIEELIDLLQFCGEGVPRLRSECVQYIRQCLTVKNCIEYIKYMVDIKSNSRDIKILIEDMKKFFVNNWSNLVYSPELDCLPTSFLVDLMKLAGQSSLQTQNKVSGLSKQEENEIRRDNLREVCLKLFNNLITSDYILTVGEKEIQVHRYILCSNAPSNLLPLGISPASGEDNGLDIVSDFKSFLLFIKFLYLSEFFEDDLISIEETQSLWETASYYIDEKTVFEDALCAWMVSGLTTKSVLRILIQMEDKPCAEVIKEAVLDFVATNMTVLAKHNQIQLLPKPVLISIIQKLN